MIFTSPVGATLKHINGALGIVTEVKGTKVQVMYLCTNKGHIKTPTQIILSDEGWVRVGALRELSIEQLDTLGKLTKACRSINSPVLKLHDQLDFYEIPTIDYNASGKSDGSSADYYKLPEGCTQLQDLISERDMNAQMGEIFRAAYRYGLASHSDKLRDAKKIKFYIEAEIKRLEAK